MIESPTTSQGILLSELSLKFKEADYDVITRLTMTIPLNGWTCLLGASGCGKTTLVKYLAGIGDPHLCAKGQLRHPYPTPLPTNVAYMAQQDTLLPWLTILDNVLLPFHFRGTHHVPENRDRAHLILKRVGLEHYATSYPAQLSGGMRQKAALARTLIQDKPLVLMDEPFSALDAVTRYQLQKLACELLHNKTVLLITHDPLEAIRLGNNVWILHGSPSTISALSLPPIPPPRPINAVTGTLHTEIMQRLGANA